jgi:hypothetical protein
MSNSFEGAPGILGRIRSSPTTQERIAQALAELSKRGVKHDYCPRCDHRDWNVDLLEVPANTALSESGLPPWSGASGYLPLLAVVCTNCGNSIFHNLNILGISLR